MRSYFALICAGLALIDTFKRAEYYSVLCLLCLSSPGFDVRGEIFLWKQR